MQTVVETDAYLSAAEDAGMTEAERAAVVNTIAASPDAGDLIVGSGGCRKVRVAGRGKGKSGGYRLITFFGGGHMPVYLLTLFSKGERANLSKAEIGALAKLTKTLLAAHQPRAVKQGKPR